MNSVTLMLILLFALAVIFGTVVYISDRRSAKEQHKR